MGCVGCFYFFGLSLFLRTKIGEKGGKRISWGTVSSKGYLCCREERTEGIDLLY